MKAGEIILVVVGVAVLIPLVFGVTLFGVASYNDSRDTADLLSFNWK